MPLGTGLTPSVALASRLSSTEGIQFLFSSVAAPFFTILGLVGVLALSLISHSASFSLLALALPILWVRSSWAFCYRGPAVEHRWSLFGLLIWRGRWALSNEDSASVDPIPDAAFNISRSRWYQLNLWSSQLQRDHQIMRSNEPDDLKRIAAMLNDAIKEVCARSAS